MRILHQLGSCWTVLGVDSFSFAHHGTVAPSPEWCASKATTKESDESDSSSSTIIHDSLREHAAKICMVGSPTKNAIREELLSSSCGKGAAVSLSSRGGDQ